MANVVEVALKINVDDSGEPLHQPMHYSIQRMMRCAFGPVRKRACVKISFKDRLQDELHSSLDNSILNGGNSEPAGLAIPFGYLYPPVLARLVVPCKKFLSNFSEKLLYASDFDGLKTLSIDTRRSVVGFCFLIRRSEGLYFTDMNIETPKPPLFSAFALRYILRLSSCRLTEGFIMPLLPHLSVEEIRLSMAPSLQRHYSPSSLLRATPPSCCLRPLSRVSGYRADLLQRFLSGAYRTSPVSVLSLSPCRRQYPAGVNYSFSQSEITHAVFADIERLNHQ